MDNYNPVEVVQKLLDEIKKEYKELKKLNVVVLGKTGVGKSTLINNIFSQKMAETGIGKPVTDMIRKYEKPDFPLAIYDTPGLELAGENAVDKLVKEVIDLINKGSESTDFNEAIHCILYCISTPSHRFEKSEVEFLKKFLDESESFSVPVIIVLTQSYNKKDAKKLKEEIEKENLNILDVVPVLAEYYDYDDGHVVKAFGLKELSEKMYETLPKAIRKTFVAVQIANIKLKEKKAQEIVDASALLAAGVGATPIPFSDAALLVPIQITMLSGITVAFGLEMDKASLRTIVTATIGTAGATILGRSIVSGLLKLIPGAGSIVGGIISAATAASLTAALGEAYIVILIDVMKGEVTQEELQSKEGEKMISDVFKERLKIERDKDGKPKE